VPAGIHSDFNSSKLDKTPHVHLHSIHIKGVEMEVKEYFEQGYEKQTAGQYKEAVIDYNRALEADKKFERAYVQRAYCKRQLKDYNAALVDYKTAISLNPNDAITYLNAGTVVYDINNRTKDTLYLDKAIEMDGDNMAEAYYLRGIIRYANTNLYELAIDDFTKAIEGDFVPEICYLRIADCYRCLDKFDKALLNYYKVLELKSSCNYYTAAAYGNIGYIKHVYKLYKEAMEYYTKAKMTDSEYTALDDFIDLCKQSLK